MIKALIILFLFTSVSFYNTSIDKLGGGTVNLSAYQGKKILLVNISTRGKFVQQIGELEQLYQQHKDRLLIIAFPSNSFDSEPHSNAQLEQLFTDSFHVTFPVSKLTSIIGSNKHAVYDWLSDSTKNGKGSINLTKDFQKILISKTGKVAGIYNSMVSPLDQRIQAAIARNTN